MEMIFSVHELKYFLKYFCRQYIIFSKKHNSQFCNFFSEMYYDHDLTQCLMIKLCIFWGNIILVGIYV